jgi:phospholipase C
LVLSAPRQRIYFEINMDSRRDFLKKAALLAAGGGMTGLLPASIQRAFAIDPAPGSTYLDAEHVVILMQENRSFDHCYGSLRGVRGFNDPRAMTLPDGNPVWLQTNAAGETYAPFRLNLLDTKATWMGSLPHTRSSQVAARNGGKHDRWLTAKQSGEEAYAQLPLTLGFYNREDLPFYYALADAFTICDQNFCSAMTCTTPNRLYLWSGTIREKMSVASKANLTNEDADFETEVNWKTFPERLEENGISWRVYQNEICLSTGLDEETESWLSNYGDNPLEYFKQYNVRFSAAHRQFLEQTEKNLTTKLAELKSQPASAETQKQIATAQGNLEKVHKSLKLWTEENFARLSEPEQNLHRQAFTINASDPDYRELDLLSYQENGAARRMKAPKGDVFHQFREDVRTGKLPTVSWIVAPENFSDHPSAPWYGAWYLSETFDILTQNPEVWKKTIFILCYDENDGYFDHVPPFMPPHPDQPGTGKVSPGIDTSVEQESLEQQQEYRQKHPDAATGPDPIGLGYRVPLVIASPWSRGGYVCSQVFDHTSVLQFLEKFLSEKTKRPIRESNITDWRRTVCGDLTSVFRPYYGGRMDQPTPVERAPFLGSINEAQFKPVPADFKNLSADQIAQVRKNPVGSSVLPQQEKGIRAACALPYEIAADGTLSADRSSFSIRLATGNKLFGQRSAGAPFFIYAPGKVRTAAENSETFEAGRTWNYAVSAGDALSDTWPLADFENGIYHLRVHGPNGFFREFRGSANDPQLSLILQPATATSRAILHFSNRDSQRTLTVLVADLAYGNGQQTLNLAPATSAELPLDLSRSFGWYDLRIRVEGTPDFEQRYAGHIETGRESFSDPSMGRV